MLLQVLRRDVNFLVSIPSMFSSLLCGILSLCLPPFLSGKRSLVARHLIMEYLVRGW